MNPRLVTPAIALASFAATLALTTGRAGLWQADPPSAAPLARAVVLPPAPALTSVTPVTAAAAEVTAAETPAAPADEPVDAPEPAAQPADTDEFLAAQDRAAAHSSRSH